MCGGVGDSVTGQGRNKHFCLFFWW